MARHLTSLRCANSVAIGGRADMLRAYEAGAHGCFGGRRARARMITESSRRCVRRAEVMKST
jgi:hypothetical protein